MLKPIGTQFGKVLEKAKPQKPPLVCRHCGADLSDGRPIHWFFDSDEVECGRFTDCQDRR